MYRRGLEGSDDRPGGAALYLLRFSCARGGSPWCDSLYVFNCARTGCTVLRNSPLELPAQHISAKSLALCRRRGPRRRRIGRVCRHCRVIFCLRNSMASEASATKYTRLPGRGRRMRGRLSGETQLLYVGDDHLLVLRRLGYEESAKRYSLNDI